MSVVCSFRNLHPATQRTECRFQSKARAKGQLGPQLGHTRYRDGCGLQQCPLFMLRCDVGFSSHKETEVPQAQTAGFD
jgi:hypothetical protein